MPVALAPPTVAAHTVTQVTVEAARLPPSPVDRAFAIVTVDEAAIATAPRLDQALVATPGVQLFRRTSSNASNPTTQGISVRSIAGSGASRALVTLDGVPQNDAFGGWVIWSGLPPIGIEQARIVRGAGAGPYGAGALTGVIQLSERTHAPEHGEYELYGGERGLLGAAAAAALGDVFVTASSEKSGGWIPVRAGRTPYDAPLFFRASSAAVRWAPDLGDKDLAVRLSGYQEARGSGVAAGNSRALGATLSATLAHAASDTGHGWRVQGWVKRSDLENRTAVRDSGDVVNEQYATPAWGAGLNAALRRDQASGGWELGFDARGATGESREHFGPGLAGQRVSGGRQSVAGLYAEGYRNLGDWLLTGGARLDRWATFDGKQIQSGLGASEIHPADRSGWVPTARAGARRQFGQDYLRAAAYAGFRPPTLNELYRPFRVGADTTLANADLQPERLYGAEAGAGGEGALSWSVTGFYNRLDDAISNVTLAANTRQRQNAGAVEAFGLEGDLRRRWGDAFSVRLAGGYTHARMDGGPNDGLRPAQTPELTLSGAATWTPAAPLSLRLEARYEGVRYDDDINSRKLGSFTELNLRGDWSVSRKVDLYAAIDNLTDAAVETAQASDGTESYDEPRTLRVGLVLRP